MEVNISLRLSTGFKRTIHLLVHDEWKVKATNWKSLLVSLHKSLWLEILYLLWPHALKINISDTCSMSFIRVCGPLLLQYCCVLTLIYREKIIVKYNYNGMGRQSAEERFCLTGELSQHLLTHAYAWCAFISSLKVLNEEK